MHNPVVRKTRRYLLVTLLIVIFGITAWFLLRPDPEPIYEGKPLSYWLDGLALFGDTTRAKAIEAVRQIGTNAVPTLLGLFNARDSQFKLKLIRLSQKQHLVNFGLRTAEFKHLEAELGFECLGSLAKSAVPGIIETYNEHGSERTDTPELIVKITGSIGPAVADAVPGFVIDTTNNNLAIRWRAVLGLGQIHAKPELAVPALIRSLRDPVDEVRWTSASSLEAFGNDAKPAVPALLKALGDPCLGVREDAAYALQKIDPEAAAQAGVK